MKEQLLRLNAINDPSSGSDVKSASSSSFSSSPAVIASNDVPSDEEFVDEYCPAPRAKPAKKKRTWSDSSLKLLALLKSEQNTVDQARKSTSNIFIRSVSRHFAVAWLLLSRAKQERKVKQRCNSSERSDRSAFKRQTKRKSKASITMMTAMICQRRNVLRTTSATSIQSHSTAFCFLPWNQTLYLALYIIKIPFR